MEDKWNWAMALGTAFLAVWFLSGTHNLNDADLSKRGLVALLAGGVWALFMLIFELLEKALFGKERKQ